MNEALTNDDKLQKVKDFRRDAITGSAAFFDRMRKADDFRNGIQWAPEVKAANEAKGKFCLTIPLIKPQIKQVVGHEIQNPKDLKVKNLRDGSATIAALLTALAKHARDSEKIRFENSMFFEAGLGNGGGYMGFFIDKSEDPRHGNIEIYKLNEFEVCFDPNCKVYDPNTRRVGAEYLIWEPWVIKEELEEEYPDKKQELKAIGSGRPVGFVMGAVSSFIDWIVGSDTEKSTTFGSIERTDVRELEKYRYQKIHTWWKQYKRVILFYDSRKSELDAVLVVRDKEIKAARKACEQWPDTFSYEEVVRPVMHHTIRVGDVFLEDIEDELNGVVMFPIVPFYGYFDNGYKSGMAEDMIGVQEEINYSHSQTLNIIKQLANTGWITNRVDDVYKRFLEEHSGEDGVILQRDKAGNFLEKIEPSTYPVGFDRFTEQAKENLKIISGVRTEDPQTAKDRVMGAIALKQQASLTGSASVLLNYDYSLTIGNNLLIEIIRNNDIYSEDEIREIIDTEDLIDIELLAQAHQMVIQQLGQMGYQMPDPVTPPDSGLLQNFDVAVQKAAVGEFQQIQEVDKRLAGQIDEAARPFAEMMLIEQIKDLKKGKYNTKVTMSPMAPTYRMAKMAELFELNKTLLENQQLPIGRKILVEATDVSQKEEIIEEGERQMAQLAAAGAR